MKDIRHHLKQFQKKTIQFSKKHETANVLTVKEPISLPIVNASLSSSKKKRWKDNQLGRSFTKTKIH